ncbi:hypothetical protein ACTFIW_003816 [Dictyostelium discoideum]
MIASFNNHQQFNLRKVLNNNNNNSNREFDDNVDNSHNDNENNNNNSNNNDHDTFNTNSDKTPLPPSHESVSTRKGSSTHPRTPSSVSRSDITPGTIVQTIRSNIKNSSSDESDHRLLQLVIDKYHPKRFEYPSSQNIRDNIQDFYRANS